MNNKKLTGPDRDVKQLKKVCLELISKVYCGDMGRPLRLLFVGCFIKEEILDFQRVFKKSLNLFNGHCKSDGIPRILESFFPKMVFYGIDSNVQTIEAAQKEKYLFETRFFTQSILDFNQEMQININETNEKQEPTFFTFDVIVYRNMLSYYDNRDQKRILEKIAGLSNKDTLIVFGKKDQSEFRIKEKNGKTIAKNDYFYSTDFDNKIFGLNFLEKRQERLENNFWGAIDFYRMSLFNRYPKYRPLELKSIKKIIKKIKKPRILIIGAGIGHQVYETAIRFAEESKKQGKNPKNAEILALEPYHIYAVNIINGHICANDLEELNPLQRKYFFKKPHPMKGIYYMALDRTKVPEIKVLTETFEKFLQKNKQKLDLILCYKTMSNEELGKILNKKGETFTHHNTIIIS